MSLFALVDCNNFFVSCERIFRPDLNGRPVVVLSSNDGCVIARSNEAKAAGVPMGAPAYQYREVFDKYGVTIFSSNFEIYSDISARVMSILSSYTPDLEMYSIDEAFLDLSGMAGEPDLEALGRKIRRHVMKWVGVPVSVGFAPTKALAKVATHIAKKFPQRTGGVYSIDSEEKRVKALKWMPVEEVWGIGRRHARMLADMGVRRAYDFTTMSDGFVKERMSVTGLRLKMELEGQSVIEMDRVQSRKNLTVSRTFETPITDFGELRERITAFAVTAARKLRRQRSLARSAVVYIRTNYHNARVAQYSANRMVRFDFDTNSDIEIVKYVVKALEEIYRKGYGIKKAGVTLMEFTDEYAHQLSMFDGRDTRHIELMKVIDRVNGEYGKSSLRLASQAGGLRMKLKQENLSPNYTTDIKDIIVVHAEE
ncbi:MAG: Y-family DNA polymerase [bacterium]|uniref:Y-family DNA polymerase n=1 Tax=Candidatus Aphodosoma intestinipullorum TaxID=2840674 RepID=A0A940DJ29_9BACT|nr:Y-family DNA polymerase [Candidatus Aphodosoma intestinipullorum]